MAEHSSAIDGSVACAAPLATLCDSVFCVAMGIVVVVSMIVLAPAHREDWSPAPGTE